VEGGLKGVNMGLLLNSLGNPDAASGRIEMSWDIETEGVTSDDLVGALDGDLKAAGQDLVIKKVSLQGLVCTAVAVVNKIPPITGLPTSTPITDLSLGIDFDGALGTLSGSVWRHPGVEMKGSAISISNLMDFGFRMGGPGQTPTSWKSAPCALSINATPASTGR
jgi:hypothetical protein